jgi:hypothetical protein
MELRTGVVWKYYDHGPRDIDFDPIVLLPGTSGTGSCFFNQVMILACEVVLPSSKQTNPLSAVWTSLHSVPMRLL